MILLRKGSDLALTLMLQTPMFVCVCVYNLTPFIWLDEGRKEGTGKKCQTNKNF